MRFALYSPFESIVNKIVSCSSGKYSLKSSFVSPAIMRVSSSSMMQPRCVSIAAFSSAFALQMTTLSGIVMPMHCIAASANPPEASDRIVSPFSSAALRIASVTASPAPRPSATYAAPSPDETSLSAMALFSSSKSKHSSYRSSIETASGRSSQTHSIEGCFFVCTNIFFAVRIASYASMVAVPRVAAGITVIIFYLLYKSFLIFAPPGINSRSAGLNILRTTASSRYTAPPAATDASVAMTV